MGNVLLQQSYCSDGQSDHKEFSWSEVLREAFLNGSVFLLLGSLLVGVITSKQGWERLEGFTGKIFYGMLTFFLLDMSLVITRKINELMKSGSFVMGFSILMPVLNALLGIFIAKAIEMSQGNALLFAVLCLSASYVAVAAATPSLYISMAMALTFLLNIIISIPIHLDIIKRP